MDSGDMSEVESNEVQPEEAVAAESEVTEPTPQGEATEQSELYIEEEDDQLEEESSNNSGMTEAQMRAAFKEERDKRKRKHAELEESKKRVQELEDRLSKVEQLALDAAVGNKPDPNEFLDASEYADAMKRYEEKANSFQRNKSQNDQQEANPETRFNLTEDQEFYAYKSKEELKKHFSDYDEVESELDAQLKNSGVNVDAAKAELIAISHLHGIDYAKSMYALKKVPGMLDKLGRAAATNNPYAIAQAMKEAASKIKERKSQPIDTKPEPEVNSSGPVNVATKELEQARKAYLENRTVQNFKVMQAAKQKVQKSKGE